jgi:Caspase domain
MTLGQLSIKRKLAAGWLSLFLSILLSNNSGWAANAASKSVYAVIVGVSTYKEGPLSGTANDAYYFADQLSQTFYVKKMWLLSEKPKGVLPLIQNATVMEPTLENLQRVLFENIPKTVEEGSLIIFFYAGHGKRATGHGNANQRGNLLLILKDGSAAAPWGNALTFNDVVSAMALTSKTYFMAFLDCCNSGPDASTFVQIDSQLEDFGIRGFGIVACASTQSAVVGKSGHGLFTESLFSVLHSDQPGHCLWPVELKDQICGLIGSDPAGAGMSPQLVFGDNFHACIPKLGTTGSLVLFEISPSLSGPFEFEFDNQTDPEFGVNDDRLSRQTNYAVYARYIPAPNTDSVTVEVKSNRGKTVVVSPFKIESQDLHGKVIEIPLPIEQAIACAQLRAEAGHYLHIFGASQQSSDAYVDAARLSFDAPDVKAHYLSTAADISPDNEMLAYAADRLSPVEKVIVECARRTELVSLLQRAGDYRAASEVGNELAVYGNGILSPDERTYSAYVSLVSARASQNPNATAAAQAVWRSFDSSQLSEDQREKVDLVFSLSNHEVADLIKVTNPDDDKVLLISYKNWQKLGKSFRTSSTQPSFEIPSLNR